MRKLIRKTGYCTHCRVPMTKILGKVPSLCSKCKPVVGISSPGYSRDWSDRLKYREEIDAWLTDSQYADYLDFAQNRD